jgi:hypothetical protein
MPSSAGNDSDCVVALRLTVAGRLSSTAVAAGALERDGLKRS